MSYANIPHAHRTIAERILTPLQLRIVILRFDGHSYRRIAVVVHRDESTVRYHYQRALDLIAAEIEEAA